MARRLDPMGSLVGPRIRERRTDREMSQAELADATGINRPNISRLERGCNSPSLGVLDRLATALDTTIMDLVAPIDGAKRMDPPDPGLTVDLPGEEEE